MELTIFLEPIFKVEGTLSAKVDSFKLSAVTTFALKAGVAYERTTDEWTGLFEPSSSTAISMGVSEDAEVPMSLGGKAQAGATVGGLLCDTAGPFLSITGFLEDAVEANFTACTLNSKAKFGAEGTVGLKAQIPLIAKEIAKVSLEPFVLAETEVANLTGPLPLCIAITGITPASGLAGDAISIAGAGFVSDMSDMRVRFEDATNAGNVLEATITGLTSGDTAVTSVEALVPTGVVEGTNWLVSVERTQAGVSTTSNQLNFGETDRVLSRNSIAS